jgi:dolichyl-phosphate-mannose-protein mannosyltransferase
MLSSVDQRDPDFPNLSNRNARDYTTNEVNVPYVTMRMLPGILGIAVVPLAYLTLRTLGTRKTTAALGAALIIFENGLVTQSRLILLDSPLVFFTALTAFFWTRFSRADNFGVHFSKTWWTYLWLTGLSLGAVVSCKWVGLFTIATTGLCVVQQLWTLLGNLKVSPRTWARHFAARALCLIVIPTLFYMFMFQIHFWILNRSGDGDGFMSSEFQHTLIGHGMEDTYAGQPQRDADYSSFRLISMPFRCVVGLDRQHPTCRYTRRILAFPWSRVSWG